MQLQKSPEQYQKITRSVGNTKRIKNTLIFIKIHAAWKQFYQSKLELPHMEFAIHRCASLSVALLLTFLTNFNNSGWSATFSFSAGKLYGFIPCCVWSKPTRFSLFKLFLQSLFTIFNALNSLSTGALENGNDIKHATTFRKLGYFKSPRSTFWERHFFQKSISLPILPVSSVSSIACFLHSKST